MNKKQTITASEIIKKLDRFVQLVTNLSVDKYDGVFYVTNSFGKIARNRVASEIEDFKLYIQTVVNESHSIK
jgi:hypothetical protein